MASPPSGDDLVRHRHRAQAHDRALVVGDVQAVDHVLEQVDVVQHGRRRSVPLGGPISPETTNCPLSQASRYLPMLRRPFLFLATRPSSLPGRSTAFQRLGPWIFMNLSSLSSDFSWL